MKKLILALLTVLLLAGCSSNNNTAVSNTGEVIIQIGEHAVNKETLYETMVYNYGASMTYSEARKMVLNKRVSLTAEQEERMQQEFETLKESLGESFEYYIIYLYGFTDEADYYENAFVPSFKQQLLAEQYIAENYNTYAFDLKPVKVNYIFMAAGEELANEVLNELQGGATFAEISEKYADVTEFDIKLDSLLYKDMNNDITAYTPVHNFASVQTELGVISPLQYDETSASYFIVEVLENDTEVLKEDFTAALATTDTSITTTAYQHYLLEGDFQIYDKTVYDAFKEAYPDYLPK